MGAVALTALALSGCDPSETSGRTDGVNLEVLVNADGSGTAQMYLDGTSRSDVQLHAWGEAVGRRLFPDAASVDVRVDPNSGGYPFVVIEAPGLYQPGPAPKVALDTSDAVGWLLDNGTKNVDVYIDSPRVPVTSSWTPPRGQDEASWVWRGITTASAAPVGSMVLSPSPWLGVLPVLLTGVSGVLLVVSFAVFRRRRRGLAMVFAAGAAVTAFGVLMGAGAVLPNNLGVAGVLPTGWVDAASVVTLLSLLFVPAAVVAFVLYAVRRPARQPLAAVGQPE